MTASVAPKISKWPFFLGDALLLALAWFVSYQSRTPTGALELCVYVVCVGLGAWISITPFLKEYQAELKFAEADKLVSVTSQIQNLDQLSAQIGYATNQWQVIRDAADKTANTAKSIAEGMAAEVKAFNAFIEKTNDGEKATLRLEVEKLRRAEVEWLQVVVRILDHVFALCQAAERSNQPGVAEQLRKFQVACLDTARRIGLASFIATPTEPFNPQRHQVMDAGDTQPPEGAIVAETAAAGYTFQGRMIRPAMVHLQTEAAPAPAEPAAEESIETPETQSSEPPTSEPEESQSNLL